MDTTTKAVPMPEMLVARAGNRTLMAIGVFKLLKSAIFFIAAIAVLNTVHRDTRVEIQRVLTAFRISGDRAIIKQILLKAGNIDVSHKKLISDVLGFYSLLFLLEGTGLLLKKRWAEYFTTILTATGIPIEVYEILHRDNALKVTALVINVAIVWFLIYHLRRSAKGHALANARE